MEYHHHTEQGQCVLTLKGKFSFTDYPGFRNDAMTLLSGEPMQLLVIDCENLDFIDSAGLGMLILMREEAEARHIRVILRKPYGQVLRMFRNAEFETLFNIEN